MTRTPIDRTFDGHPIYPPECDLPLPRYQFEKTIMKARPMLLARGVGYVECETHEATHLRLHIPGPTGLLVLPVLQGNTTRAGTPCWTWNGSTDAPTLRPSVLTQYDGADRQWRCHSWITDGTAQFLADSTHDMANTIVELIEVKS